VIVRSPAVEWLYSLQHFGIKLGLDSIRALLDLLDRPDRAFPVIHVAGTNGKGSVCAMLDAVLRASGRRVGLFTSPHLVRPNERIRIDGEDIADDALDDALLRMRATVETAVAEGRLEAHPSFFEIVTAVALQQFRRAAIDVAVLEVGLGGRLDATNAADTDLSVVVSVDLDHTRSLGDTVEQIAAEKGGIVRAGVPVVSGVERPEASAVLRAIAAERGAPWIDARESARIESGARDTFSVITARARYDGLRCALPGRHQFGNARVAVVALETWAPEAPSPANVAAGLASTRWPGRLQWLSGRPRTLLDGAHNPAGIATLVAHLAEARIAPRPVLLFGTTREKRLDDVLAPLLPWVSRVVAGRAGIDRAMDPEEIVAWGRDRSERFETAADAGDGIARARALAGPDGVVLVAGSLYLVGDVLTALEAGGAPGPVAM